jgi:preprotein translocase subunit SecY
VRGFGVRWPLNFLYTSVIPVTLVAALLANIQLVSVLVERSASSPDQAFLVLGQSLSFWFEQPRLVQEILTSSSFLAVPWQAYVRALWYILILAGGSVLFAWFWMQTSGMDAHSVAKQIMASGLQIPGFRSDPRVIEHILARYIGPLTIMGGLTIGVLSALADILGSLTSGTGLLLAVMIVYRMYEDIAKQHISDMNPALRQFMGRGN